MNLLHWIALVIGISVLAAVIFVLAGAGSRDETGRESGRL
jgi:hypothetical protein